MAERKIEEWIEPLAMKLERGPSQEYIADHINVRSAIVKWMSELIADAYANRPVAAPSGKWSEYMAEVQPCGHTNAQHEYHQAGDCKLQPCPVVAGVSAETEETVRAEFEKTVLRLDPEGEFSLRRFKDNGQYINGSIQLAWEVWRVARNSVSVSSVPNREG